MKIRFLKAKYWLLVSIMSLLGLASCEKQKDMYGCPETNFADTTPNQVD